MIEDEVRVRSFRKAIFATCPGKVVLDVGCGSGILALFAAQAGARRVVAVEGSARTAGLAKEAVRRNGYEDRVAVVCGRIEDEAVVQEVNAELLRASRGGVVANGEDPKVDVLVSEWMGYMLVHEDMFPSVAAARDRWLRPDGCMIPSACSIWAAPFCGREFVEELSGFWQRELHGLDMSHLADPAMQEVCTRPVIDELEPEYLLARPERLWRLDCSASPPGATRSQCLSFSFVLQRAMPLHGLAVWFKCSLAPGIGFSTGPAAEPTHWAQTLLFSDHFGEHEGGNSAGGSTRGGLPCGRGDRVEGELHWRTSGRDMHIQLQGLRSRPTGEADAEADASSSEVARDVSVQFSADMGWSLQGKV